MKTPRTRTPFDILLRCLGIVYLAGFLVSYLAFASDAHWCFRARWPTNPFTASEAIVGTMLPALAWPVTFPGAGIASKANDGHLCTFGGKPGERREYREQTERSE